jgi:uncharacterized protein YqhQ
MEIGKGSGCLPRMDTLKDDIAGKLVQNRNILDLVVGIHCFTFFSAEQNTRDTTQQNTTQHNTTRHATTLSIVCLFVCLLVLWFVQFTMFVIIGVFLMYIV